MREFLLISYLYPPIVNAGTQHVIHYTRYLAEMGYRPVILTAASRGGLADDADNFVFRTGEVFGSLKRLYRSVQLRAVTEERHASMTVTPKRGIGRLLRQWAIPDLQATWYPFALQRGRNLIKNHPIRALYTTSGPETNHLVGLALKRETGLPWVADFRDGWLFEPLIDARLTLPLRRRIETRMERAVVRNADQITTLNQRIADGICTRYPEAANKITVIGNGFDSADFANLQRRPTGKFTLVHTGSLSLSRSGTTMDGFLQALTMLKAEDHALLHDLEIVMVGRLTEEEVASVLRAGVSDLFRLVEEVSHKQALQYQINAEVLLLITHPSDLAVSTTKLFEYLGARRPVLGVTPNNSSAGLILHETNAGIVAPPHNPDMIASALVTLYRQWKTSELERPTNASVERYEYRFLTSQLATLFDQIIPE